MKRNFVEISSKFRVISATAPLLSASLRRVCPDHRRPRRLRKFV